MWSFDAVFDTDEEKYRVTWFWNGAEVASMFVREATFEGVDLTMLRNAAGTPVE